MQAKDEQLKQNAVQIATLEAKINTIPSVKVALEGINNQYTSAKTSYDELLKKRNDANLGYDRANNAQGALGNRSFSHLPRNDLNLISH